MTEHRNPPFPHESKLMSNVFYTHALTPDHLGILPQPDGQSNVTGQCGDSIEVYLKVEGETIDRASFLPHGCLHTVACGDAVASLADGHSLDEALALTPDDVERELGGLPADHRHCAELALAGLWEAAMDYYKNKKQGWKKLYR